MPYRLATPQKRIETKMGREMGFEPTTSGTTIRRSNQLGDSRRFTFLAHLKGFEPPTHGLEGRCSILLSYRRKMCAEVRTFGAGDGNRTHATSLEGWCSTIELHPRFSHNAKKL